MHKTKLTAYLAKAGEINGQAFVHFGGTWWVESAAGQKITSKP